MRTECIVPGCQEANASGPRSRCNGLRQADRRRDAWQQARVDTFIEQYNRERPHQALAMKVPAEFYTPSPRPYRGLQDVDDPLHDWTATVRRCGRICWNRRKINVSTVSAGQDVGVRQVSDRIWLVSFMDYDLGYFDDETYRLEPIANPFSPKVLPMSPQ